MCHSYTINKNETLKLVEAFKDRITQIHLSGTYRKKHHQSMRIVTKDFLKSIEPIFDLDVPIIIEEDIKIKDIGEVKKEISMIKKLFE